MKQLNNNKYPSVNQITDGLIRNLKQDMMERYSEEQKSIVSEIVTNLKETFN